MCYNCGCFNPSDDMGNSENITEATFENIAKRQGKSVGEIKKAVYKMLEVGKVDNRHLVEMFEKAAKAWGQSVEEAKKNTLSLLKHEIG